MKRYSEPLIRFRVISLWILYFLFMPMSIRLSLLHRVRQYRSPYTVAVQSSLLRVKKRDKILEIGTGSGYQTAILAEMGAKVYTIERYRDLFIKAQRIFNITRIFCRFFFMVMDMKVNPSMALFDGIIITAAASDVPNVLLHQLKTGGRLVVPLGGSGSQVMTVVERTGPEFSNVPNMEIYFCPYA